MHRWCLKCAFNLNADTKMQTKPEFQKLIEEILDRYLAQPGEWEIKLRVIREADGSTNLISAEGNIVKNPGRPN